jgi:hypothetical protein
MFSLVSRKFLAMRNIVLYSVLTIKYLSDSSNTSGKNVTYFDGSKSTSPKGQLISKGLFDVIVLTKNPLKGSDHLAHSWGGLGRFLGSQ